MFNSTKIKKERKTKKQVIKLIIKRFLIAILTFIIILIVPGFIPIKFVKKSIDSVKENEFYIIYFISEASTEGGLCSIIGDQDGMWDNEIGVHLTGKDLRDYIISSIYNSYTKFIIYGTLIKETSDGYKYTLDIEGWDILEEVKGGLHKRFITIYDLKWIDKLFPPPWK